jgi:hypothetical protein
MVNGEDYNNFPYTLYNSIIKSRAINRSSIGVSKNLDLLDPTGKYSSINSFGNDGAMWQNDENGVLTLTVNNTSDIIAFFSDSLNSVLALNRANQYYISNSSDSAGSWYKRFDVNTSTGDGTVYWQTSSVDANSETGYFYTLDFTLQVPDQLGVFSTTNTKYVTKGALLKFAAPSGFYFDSNNRLVAGVAGTNPTVLWTTVLNVVGDGTNNGEGNFSNGTGPVTLNGYVPNGVILTQIIPVFDNSLSVNIIQEAILKIELQQNFTLVFNNSLLIDQERWSIKPYTNENWFIKFTSLGNNRYTVEYKSLRYYFGSVADTRFTYALNELVYDPFSGKILQDFINVLGINTQPNSSTALGIDKKINIVGQTVETDGYVNDFEVEIAATDVNNKQLILNPDYFTEITGVVTNATNFGRYVFFEEIQDAINLTRQQIVPTSEVVFQFPTKDQIEVVKYEYPVGQIFFAYNEGENGEFYTTVQDTTVRTPFYTLVIQPQYSYKFGRQGLSYQYKHNSNNTTRIDPATTNIIDLYVVTQSYYTQYQNYIQDSTNTIPEPPRPTINELTAAYSKVNDYKMLSDSVVLNSVVFKPLFGEKAAAALRGTIKVIKNSTTSASDSEIKSAVLSTMNDYFNINNWNFGDTFYFSELSAYLHNRLGDLISSTVLVPNSPNEPFGTLYEIKCAPYEIFANAATSNDVVVIAALTPDELQVA